MSKEPISQYQIQRKHATKKLREVLYVANSFYGESEDIKVSQKAIDSNIFSSLFRTLKYESIGNKDKIEQVIETILYGRELEDFKKFDYTTRKELLNSYQLPGILSISKKEKVFKKLEKQGTKKTTSKNRIENLEKRIENTNKIRELIPEIKMNQNSFEYLNSFIDLYQAIKGENGIQRYEIEDIKYQSQLLTLTKNKPEVTAIETQDVLLNLYDSKFKGIKKNNFFEKLRQIYLLKTNGAASQIKIKDPISDETYTPKIRNRQTKKPEKKIQIEEKLEITPEDEFNLKLAEYNINKAETIQTNIQEKFNEELKTRKSITQADKLEELVQQEEKKLKIQAEYCPTRKHHIGYEMIE